MPGPLNKGLISNREESLKERFIGPSDMDQEGDEDLYLECNSVKLESKLVKTSF